MLSFFRFYLLYILITIIAAFFAIKYLTSYQHNRSNMKVVAIANYGPHVSLEETIKGLKSSLTKLGYVENNNVRYVSSDVNFDLSLIRQMLATLYVQKPDLIVTLATPVAQGAYSMISDIPMLFLNVSDPLSMGLNSSSLLAKGEERSTMVESGIIGSKEQKIAIISDKQNLGIMLDFVKKILPTAKKLGVLYSTAESNDVAMINNFVEQGAIYDMSIMSVPLDHASEVALRIRTMQNNVDFIYVGSSGVIQSAFSAIAKASSDMNLPVITFDNSEVLNGSALASFGVSYEKIGEMAGEVAAKILIDPNNAENYKIIYPQAKDHKAYISRSVAQKYKIELLEDLNKQEIEFVK